MKRWLYNWRRPAYFGPTHRAVVLAVAVALGTAFGVWLLSWHSAPLILVAVCALGLGDIFLGWLLARKSRAPI